MLACTSQEQLLTIAGFSERELLDRWQKDLRLRK